MSDEQQSYMEELLRKLDSIDNQLKKVEEHPSQNGGWKSLMGAVNEIKQKLDGLHESINNPESGVRANVNELRDWRSRVEPVLNENRKQDERLLKLEMQVGLYNKVTWVVGAGVLGLIVQAIAKTLGSS